MKIRLFAIFLLVIMLLSTYIKLCSYDNLFRNTPLHIEPFYSANRAFGRPRDTLVLNYRGDYYLVTGYEDTPEIEQKIDSFVCQHKDTNYLKYDQYGMIFYRKTNTTNDTYIEKYYPDHDGYDLTSDHLYSYGWINGRFAWKEKSNQHTHVPMKTSCE
jgi:hypothetical protein